MSFPAIDPGDDAEQRELASAATLLDYYTSAAMRALLAEDVRRGLEPDSIAARSFDVGLAMVKERRRRLPKAAP